LREWRLEEVLGAGGFGIVYRGTDIYFGESVAIKEYFPGAISDRIDGTTVTPTDSSSEEIYTLGRQKFMEEAKVLWNLSHPERHPNIVAVRSLFEIHGTAYMVMDFESGQSLAQMLKDGKRFDEKSLMAVIRPIAEGLERTHRAGVLHRDIKPANILVSAEGRPVLIDFGSARFESNQATNTKVTFYTPPYAALEQYVKSYPQGPWTDIYALGVVLYQCVTGEKPPEVLERLHGEGSKLLSSREWPGFSPAFTHAVDAAMAVRPLERPSTISSWLKLLDAADAPTSDEVTRVAVLQPAPAAASKESAARPVAKTAPERKPEPKKAPAAKAQPGAKAGGKFVVAGLGFAALFSVLALASLVINRLHKSEPASTPAVASAANPQAAGTDATLTGQMDGLIDAANKAHIKPNDIAMLSDARSKLTSLAAAKAPAEQIVAAASAMAKSESDSLGRTQRRMLRDMGTMPGPADAPGSADAVAKLQKARDDLNAALAAPIPQDGTQIIAQTQLAISSFVAFQDAYGAATPFLVTARRNSFDGLHTATKSLCDQVSALASVEKPWFLASSARKNAYQLRQDNAAQAKAMAQQLDDLARTVAASNDLKELSAAISQATDDKAKATQLYALSSAAAL
jgi:tRNA A-37 threonylcarbamoyl transferase component Bud32